jgi:hypothetical protein
MIGEAGRGDYPPAAIGCANLDRTGVNQNLITAPATPQGMALDGDPGRASDHARVV